MTPTRFAALAAAYGSDIDRWPAGERGAARAHAQHFPEAASILAAEAGLDAALLAWTVPAPGAALVGRIVSSPGRQRISRVRLWLSSLGVAATLTGGVAAGMLLVPLPSSSWEAGTSHLYELQVLGAPLDLELPAGDPVQ